MIDCSQFIILRWFNDFFIRFLGLITVGLAVITANLDGVLQLGNTAMGVLAGPLLAIFLLGFFTTAANKYVRFYDEAITILACGSSDAPVQPQPPV